MATLPGAPVASQESSINFPVNLIGKYNIQQRGKNYPCRKRNTFPSKDKKFLLWRASKNPLSAWGFSSF
jgi:hypothetical protein